MLVVLALVAAAVPTRVSAACEVEPWSEWSSCEPKTRFSGCEYAAGAPAWRAPPVSAAVNQKATPNLRGPDNAAAVEKMMMKMKRQGEAMARASAECEDTDNGATDRDGDGCAEYQGNPSWCGNYDDDDFSSNVMCCACKPIERGPATCEDGDADGFGCLGVDLESWTPIARLGPSASRPSLTNDNWGWTSAEGREWALQCADNGVAFVDLGCPSCDPPVAAAEAVEDFVETATWRSDWRDLKVYDHYALIVSEAAGHGLQIFDLERLDPSHARHDKDGDGFYDPDARTTFGGSLGSAHNVVVNEETARAYAVGVEGATGSSTCNGGLLGVDIRDPTMPKWLGCLFDDAYVHDAQCVVYRGPDVEHFGREICFLSTESEVRIVDVTDASDGGGDVTLSLLAYEGAEYAHQGWLTCDHTTLFVDDELDEYYDGVGTKTFVLDVADLDAPRVRFVHTADAAFIDHNQYVNGAFLYQANYAGGLRVLDISDAELGGDAAKATGRPALAEVAYFDVLPDRDTASFLGSWNAHPFFASGRVVVNDVQAGTAIVKPTGLTVETRARSVTARDAGDVCPNLFQERSCAAPPADACAGLEKGKCTKAATCEYKKRTCRAKADACAGLSRKRCKKTSGCRYKRKRCRTFDCAALEKKKCKKDESTCKWRRKKKKCAAK